MKTPVKTLYIVFDYPTEHHQLHEFASKFNALGELVYHRDREGKNIQGYSSVQFREHGGYAAVFAVNEGATAIAEFVDSNSIPIRGLPKLDPNFELKKLTGSASHFYRLFRWIPMDERYFPKKNNSESNGAITPKNAVEGQSQSSVLPDHDNSIRQNGHDINGVRKNTIDIKPWNQIFMDEKVRTLEKILVSNIIEFAQSVNWKISNNKSLQVRLHDIHHINTVNLFDTDMLAFDITYSANVALPEHLGLGRGKSVGYGWQLLSRHNEEMQKLHAPVKRAGEKVP